jgi:hypothetical protein
VTLIIGLAGAKKSGKDTCGDHILRLASDKGIYNAKKYAFAFELKEFCIRCFNLPRDVVYGTDEQKNTTLTEIRWSEFPLFSASQIDKINKGGMWGLPEEEMELYYRGIDKEFMTVREVLQYFGTEIVRRIYSEAWVISCLNRINEENPDLAVIIDARFPNEVTGLKYYGGKTVRLTRQVHSDGHASETSLLPENFDQKQFDYVVDNQNQTKAETLGEIERIFTEVINDQ